ncbi:uncharacterized protein LOC142634846 [Castanea sativa]|uniref:uncharacterized protein LOC142634846 n=1 Tax=Castanea sativa TaxID=21020 RepID=UPI003F649CCF
MSCLAWNCCGLGNLRTGKELVEIVRAKDPAVVFLVETRTDDARLEFVQSSIGFDHRWVVPRVGRNGGLVHYWRASVNLKVEGSDRYYIDAVIKNSENEWRLTGFFGEPDTARRHEARSKLRNLNSHPEKPWLCFGDFNEIIRQDEKLGSARRPHYQMQQFREVIDECGFMDLGFEGSKFTWSKHFENGSSIWERLDRCLVTNSWFMKFAGSRVFHLTCTSSDHVPILISLLGLSPPVRKKIFHFEQMWLSDSSCEEVVYSVWGSGSGLGDGGNILRKVERCGKELGHWEKNVFGNVRMELNRLKKVLANEERAAMISGNNFQVRQIKKDIEVLQDREATMWAQCSRVLWANQGDKNSKYFHCCATKRFWKNAMEGIRDEEGVWRTTQEEVGEIMVNYYKTLFSSTEGSVLGSMLECVPTVIDEEMNAALCKEFEACEVISALQQ